MSENVIKRFKIQGQEPLEPDGVHEPKVVVDLAGDGSLMISMDGWYVISFNRDGTFTRHSDACVGGLQLDDEGRIVESEE